MPIVAKQSFPLNLPLVQAVRPNLFFKVLIPLDCPPLRNFPIAFGFGGVVIVVVVVAVVGPRCAALQQPPRGVATAADPSWRPPVMCLLGPRVLAGPSAGKEKTGWWAEKVSAETPPGWTPVKGWDSGPGGPCPLHPLPLCSKSEWRPRSGTGCRGGYEDRHEPCCRAILN